MKSTRELFEAWGKDEHADGMASHHWRTVKQAFDLIPDSDGNYLEIGVGNGYGIEHMARHQFARGKCLGLDVAESMVNRSCEKTRDLDNVSIHQGDFLSWDFTPNDLFSLIFSMEVFYYFPDIQQGLDKAFSLLVPDGQLWVLVNFYQENPQSHDWPEQLDTPMTMWSSKNYVEGFEKAGFTGIQQRFFQDPVNDKDNDGPTLATFGVKPV